MPQLRTVLLIILSAVVLVIVVTQTTPPSGLKEVSLLQFLIFIIPLFSLFSSLINLYRKSWLKSVVAGISIVLLLIIKGLNELSIFTIAGTFIALFSIWLSLKRPKPLNQPKSERVSKLLKQG